MKKVFIYVHSHWDREWYRPFEEFRLRLVEVADDILEKLQKNELPSFYFDGQTSAIEDYLEIYPEKEGLVKKLIAQKRLFTGPFYCSADNLLVSSEFLIRNLKIGIEKSKSLGCKDFTGYLSDTFGHSGATPSVLRACGVNSAMLWRGLGEIPSEFLWDSIFTTNLIQGYFQDIFSLNADYDKKAKLLGVLLDKLAQKSGENILLPAGADHLKIADNLKEQVSEINKRLKSYKLVLSNPFEYLEAVKDNYKKEIKGEFLDCSKTFLLKGVYSSRIYQKRQNKLMEWDLSQITEPLAALGAALGVSKSYQNEIDHACKILIQNHAHDSIYGCATDEVHQEVDIRFKKAEQISKGVKKRVERDFSLEGGDLKFINLSNFEFSGAAQYRTDKVLDKKFNAQLINTEKGFPDKKLYDADEIPVTEDMTKIRTYLIDLKSAPAWTISDAEIEKNSSLKITDKKIENDKISLEIKNGKIEIKDKIQNKTLKNILEITDRADIGDSYTFGALKGDKKIKAKLLGTKIVQKGHIQSILRLIYEIKRHKIYADVILENQADYLKFDLNWENKAKNHILQVELNLPAPVTKTVSEDTLGLVEREFEADYDIYAHVPAARGVELKTNTAPIQKFVWTQGLGAVTKGLQEYEVEKNKLKITILRATGLISEPKNPCRGTPAGPPLECPELQCLGKNRAEFALKFASNPHQLFKIAEEFYGKGILTESKISPQKIFEVDNKNVLISAVKYNNTQKAVVVRLVNTSDKTEKFNFSSTLKNKEIYLSNVFEETISPAKLPLKINTKEIMTFILTQVSEF